MTKYEHGKHPNSINNLKMGNHGQGFNSRTASEAKVKSDEAKRRKRTIRENLTLMLSAKADKINAATLAKIYGIPKEEVTVEHVMHAQQVDLAIVNHDTKAYNAVLDRVEGKAPQAIVNTDASTKPEELNKAEKDILERLNIDV